MEPYLLTLKAQAGKKTWVALILGRARGYGLAREFIESMDERTAPERRYLLDEPGLYELCEEGERRFLMVRPDIANYTPVPMSKEEAWRHAIKEGAKAKRRRSREATARRRQLELECQARQAEAERVSGEVDDVIARFNAEGGFRLEPGDN